MAIYQRNGIWYYDFVFAGKRFKKSCKTHRKTVAADAEQRRVRELEATYNGIPQQQQGNRIRSVSDVVKTYSENYPVTHREQSIAFSEGRLAHVKRLLGTTLISDVTEDAILKYMKTRLADGASGRTVNMEVGELTRALGHKWSVLWPKVRKLEERKDAGQALSPEQERRLLEVIAADESPNRSQVLGTFIRIALLTGMRSGEISRLTWGQIDLGKRVLTVGRAKTPSGTGRQIPLNQDLFATLSMHASWYAERFKDLKPAYYLFPFGKPTPKDPTRPFTTMKTAWANIRKKAKLDCRLHDLRHTAATKMAEAGTPESTMLSIMGHMSRAMLERYSHIRMAAKRSAIESLALSKAPVETPTPVFTPATESDAIN